jgi:hypothetical protein
MDLNALAAWLALLLAAASLAWQVWEARRRRSTRLRVEVAHVGAPASLEGDDLLTIPALGLDRRAVIWHSEPSEVLAYILVVVVVNDGETVESVADIRVLDASGRRGVGADNSTGSRELPPRDRVLWAFRPDAIDLDLRDGFRVAVALDSGSGIVAGPFYLDDQLIAALLEHNEPLM